MTFPFKIKDISPTPGTRESDLEKINDFSSKMEEIMEDEVQEVPLEKDSVINWQEDMEAVMEDEAEDLHLPKTDWEDELRDVMEDEPVKDDLAEKNDSPEKNPPIQNKVDGLRREHEVEADLEEQYPPEEGYETVAEAYLRDSDGHIVRDPETGEARRVDFMVVRDGKVVDSIEVTSNTADKTEQTAKEERIRDMGGNYIKDGNGNLVEIPKDVHTRIERRD